MRNAERKMQETIANQTIDESPEKKGTHLLFQGVDLLYPSFGGIKLTNVSD